MNILDQSIENKIQDGFIPAVLKRRYLGAVEGIGTTLDEEIDARAYRLYGLTEEEKMIVEG